MPRSAIGCSWFREKPAALQVACSFVRILTKPATQLPNYPATKVHREQLGQLFYSDLLVVQQLNGLEFLTFQHG